MGKAKTANKRKQQKNLVWKPFIRFYTRFRIPWWLFIVSFGFGILYTELGVKITEYTILINKGELFNAAILGYAAFTLLNSLVSIARNMSSNYGSGLVTLRAREIVYHKILCLPVREFDREQPSSYVSRITSDVPQASSTITTLAGFAASVYSFVRYYIAFFRFNSELTLWLLLAVPLAVLVFYLVGKTAFLATRKIYASINEMMSFFSEHLGAIKHVKAQAMEKEEREEGYKIIEKRFKADMFNALMSAFQVTINSIYTKACTLILVFVGKGLIDKGKMETTGLVAGDQYLTNVQKYLAELLTQYQTVKGVQGVLNKVSYLAECESEQMQRVLPMPKEQGDILLKDVNFSYTEEKEILHHISLLIPAGKKTAIVGDNGSGKSTLFKLLMRFYQPSSGEIRYGEDNAEDIHLNEWRSSFGYVLQNAPLFSGSIRENILYGCDREVSEEELIAAAKNANAYEFILEFSEGFDKEVGEGGMHLSGGQRQRIAVARALVTNPKILLMDEATASLDYRSDALIWQAIERLMEGRTTVLIAHDMNAVMIADNVVVMKEGKIEATGTHSELMKISPTYREYVSLQTSGGQRA